MRHLCQLFSSSHRPYLSLSLFQQLEQEKHRLRLQIEVMEDEYEQRIADLRSDLAAMKTRDRIQHNSWQL